MTTVCAMPNTKPITDTKEMVADVHQRAVKESPVHVIQLGAVTKGEAGKGTGGYQRNGRGQDAMRSVRTAGQS